MHLHLNGQTTINAPADKVWRVLAHEFGNIGQYASAIAESKAVTDIPAPKGAEVGGRVCTTTVPGVDAVRETFTYYDEQSMRFGYNQPKASPGLSSAPRTTGLSVHLDQIHRWWNRGQSWR